MTNIQILKQLIQLEEKKIKLAAELAGLEAQIEAVKSKVVGGGGAVAPVKAGRAAKAVKVAAPAPAKVKAAPAAAAPGGKKRGKYGQVSEDILAVLKAAGKEGIAIKDIAAKAKRPEGSVRVWLATTGKKTKGLKKVSRGVYALAA